MVYVDALQQVRTTGSWKYREACHLLADTLDELHAFAAQIKLKRAWYQPRSAPHYDLTRSKRAAAVKAGAVELDRLGVVALLRRGRVWEMSRQLGATEQDGGPA